MELRFHDGRDILLYLAADGESVRAAAAPLELTPAFELEGGGTCAWVRVDLGQTPDFGRLVERAVVGVDAVIDTWPTPMTAEIVVGWVVRFITGDFIAYLNLGDDAKLLLNALPVHPDGSIRTRIESVESCQDRAEALAAAASAGVAVSGTVGVPGRGSGR